MLKKVFFVILLSATFSSCVFFVRDNSRALHPTMDDSTGVVYVKGSGHGDSVNAYRIGLGSIPVWCDIDEKYAGLFLNTSTQNKMLAVCYSNKKPNSQDIPASNGSMVFKYSDKDKGGPSVEEIFNPFSKAYLFSVFISPSKYDDFFVLYFDIYRKFCQRDGVSCCMTGERNLFKFSMLLEEPENIKQLYMEMDSVVTYINSSQKELHNVASLYGAFSSFVYDKCSFNRWYYDVIAAGLVSPESFFDLEKWEQMEGKTLDLKIKGVDVRLVDYQKISMDDKKWLEVSIKNLTERF